MKICFVASTYPRFENDGAARFVLSMAEALVELGHEVHVLAPWHPKVKPFSSPVQVHHFRYVWPNSLLSRFYVMGYAEAMKSDRALRPISYALAPAFALALRNALRRLHHKHQFDVIHAHWVIPNGFLAAQVAQATDTPLFISLHGSDIFVARNTPVLRRLARWTFRQAEAVTSCSPELKAGALAMGARDEQVHLVPWGASIDTFAAAEAQREQRVGLLRQKLGVQPAQPVVMTLGRLVAKKGIEYLVRAMPQIVEKVPDVRCLIVGDGPEEEPLRQLAASLGVAEQVVFAGRVRWDAVPDYLALCDIFVVPSIHDEKGNVDGLPTTIPEAMAAGKPVVASRVAGIPLVVADGETGRLVPEKNANALAAALLDLLHSPLMQKEYGALAQERVKQEFNWRRVAERFLELYEQKI